MNNPSCSYRNLSLPEYCTGDYRFGFQGQETDPEYLSGAVSFKYRVHDARIGRFLSVDPLTPKYPHYSPYSFSGNKVISFIELEGLEESLPWYLYNNPKRTKPVLTLGLHNLPPAERDTRESDDAIWLGLQTISNATKILYNGFVSGVRGDFTGSEMLMSMDSQVSHFLEHSGPSDYVDLLPNSQEDFENLLAMGMGGMISKMTSVSGFTTSKMPSPLKGISLKNSSPQNGPGFYSLSANVTGGKININGMAVSNGRFDFVILESGELRIGFGHNYLSEGASQVQAAGQIKLFNGKVQSINNSSGHYMPSMSEAGSYGDLFKAGGIDVSGAQLQLYDELGKLGQTSKIE
jgi:RHS repeat-associated protein